MNDEPPDNKIITQIIAILKKTNGNFKGNLFLKLLDTLLKSFIFPIPDKKNINKNIEVPTLNKISSDITISSDINIIIIYKKNYIIFKDKLI